MGSHAGRRRRKDRTPVFLSLLLDSKVPAGASRRSDLQSFAASAVRDIRDISTKLEELTRVAKKTEVLYAREIQELSSIIKSDIRDLQSKIAGQQSRDSGKRQPQQHAALVLSSLQEKLLAQTTSFKTIMSTRAIKAERAHLVEAQLSSSAAVADATARIASLPLLPAADPNNLDSLPTPLQRLSAQEEYASQRLKMAQDISAMVEELQTVFVDVRRLVREQHNAVITISDEIKVTESHIDRARERILQYWRAVSNDRSLPTFLLLLFLVLLLCFVLFV